VGRNQLNVIQRRPLPPPGPAPAPLTEKFCRRWASAMAVALAMPAQECIW